MSSRGPLQGIERLWLAADRHASPFVVHAVIDGTGDTFAGEAGLRRLEEAVEIAARSHPRLRARLTGWGPWTRWTRGPGPRVRSVDGAGWEGLGPDGAPWLDDPLPLRTGPLAEVLLVRGQAPRVVLRAHHAAVDGRAMGFFLRSLFQVLRGETPTAATVAPRDVELLAALSPTPPPRWAAPPRDRLPLTGPVTDRAPLTTWARVRAEAVGARDLLPRVLVALERARLGDRPAGHLARVSLPVDLRPPGAAWDGNLTGIATLPDTALASVESARAAIRAARDPRACGRVLTWAESMRWMPVWLLAAAGAGATRAQLGAGRFETTATVSNLGRVDLAELSCPGFSAGSLWWIPPRSPGNALFVLVSGDARGVELVAEAPVGLASEGRLGTLLARAVAALRDDADGGTATTPRG